VEFDPDIEKLRRQREALAGVGAETESGLGSTEGMGSPMGVLQNGGGNPISQWIGNVGQRAEPEDLSQNINLRQLQTTNALSRDGAVGAMDARSPQGSLPGEGEMKLGILARLIQELGL